MDNNVFSKDNIYNIDTSKVENSYDENFTSEGAIKSIMKISKSIKNNIVLFSENFNLCLKIKNNVQKILVTSIRLINSMIKLAFPKKILNYMKKSKKNLEEFLKNKLIKKRLVNYKN